MSLLHLQDLSKLEVSSIDKTIFIIHLNDCKLAEKRLLSSCSSYELEGTQNCGDGYCVDPSDICDGRVDCLNGHDEMHCSELTTVTLHDYHCVTYISN